MSRSRKKAPYISVTTARSEKTDKRLANRKDRRLNNVRLETTQDDTKAIDRRATSNVWAFDKDGKQRIDPKSQPKALRK